MTNSPQSCSADSARMAQLAEEIEDSYSGNFVEDILLHESDRRLIVTALNGFAGVAQAVGMPSGHILVPRKLTAENGAKSALIGEFSEEFGLLDEDGNEQYAKVAVTWTTIKAIHEKMVAHFDASRPSPAATVEARDAVDVLGGTHDHCDAPRPQCSAATEHAKVADWLEDQARIATNSLHCGDNSAMIQQTHDWANKLEAAARHLRAVPQSASMTAPREMWAMLYLHDWDPPKEGQEHRWEPGKNVFPEIHNVYETLREANTVLSRMSDPKKYWVRRVWMPAHDTSALPRPLLCAHGVKIGNTCVGCMGAATLASHQLGD